MFIGRIIAILATLMVLSSSFYILDQTKTAIVLQFGKFVEQATEPGLNFKIPLIQDVLFFDNRIHNISKETIEVIASDQKTLRVDAFAKYRIIDALAYYQSVNDEVGLQSRLSPIIESSIRQVLGGVPFKALITPQRTELMHKIKEIVATQAMDFGIKVVDVRIVRADLPDPSRDAVYERMKSEREKEAKEIRAEGAEKAQVITATAEKERQIILAEAQQKAQVIKGEGEAEAIKAFSESIGRDPEFYEFYRTMEAYKKTLGKDTTRLVISPDSDFFKYLKKSH
jgi:membrane protease subunit HflC